MADPAWFSKRRGRTPFKSNKDILSMGKGSSVLVIGRCNDFQSSDIVMVAFNSLSLSLYNVAIHDPVPG